MIKIKYRKALKIFAFTLGILFILTNVIIIIQAYSLTHFTEKGEQLTHDYKPGLAEKVSIALFGLKVPKPKVKNLPVVPYETIFIEEDKGEKLEAWLLKTDSVKEGLVICFHGYMDEKSSMLDRAYIFLKMRYNVLLVDFMGAGGSYGYQSTMGFLEAKNVKTVYDYANNNMDEDKIILIGFSMGAAAIIKAQYEYDIHPIALITEAPYGTFRGTVDKRLDTFNMPHWPISYLFTFWTGKINGFDAFSSNPEDYAKQITTPILVMGGGKDQNIPIVETERIYNAFTSKHKHLTIFPESSHESYILKYPDEWERTVDNFLNHQ